jgi:hypothetical protein
LLWRHALDSLICDRYFENAPTVGLIADVVERLERQPAHQRGITDHDRDALHAVAQIAGLSEPLRDRQAGPRVAAVEHVVRRLRAAWEAADAIERAQRPEAVEAAGQQLVRVGLVSGVPHDAVARRLEQPVQGDGELDDAERRAEMAAGLGDGRDDRLADLGGELDELRLGQPAQLGGPL